MEPKKNPEVNLERKKGLFLQIGLIIALLVVLGAFEYKTYEKIAYNLGSLSLDDLEEEIIPITQQEVKPPPPPPPPPEIIEIVEDDVVIEDEIEIEDTESDEDEVIEIIEEDDEEVFMVVEKMPEFTYKKKKGAEAIFKFINEKVSYPAIAKEYNITGKVYVSYVVDRSGKVINVKVVRGVDKNLDAEAVRVVKLMSPWYTSGKQRGKSVNVLHTIPINFTLN